MRFESKDCQLLCKRGSAVYNEDIIGMSPYGVWVLDGATGLNNKNLVSNESDAKWYVNWWDKYLHNNIHQQTSIKEIMEDGIDEINKQYYKLLEGNKVEALDFPSCSGVVLKYHIDKIEYLLLGDCSLLVKKDEVTTLIKDHRLEKYDDMVFDFIDKIKGHTNLTLDEKKQKAMPLIISNRLKKNTSEGYWALGFEKEAIKNVEHGFIHVDDDIQLMLMSDGFSCGYEKYSIFEQDSAVDIAKHEGLEYMYDLIRELEKNDENGIVYPRFKVHDDSSCIYLNIHKQQY